MFRKVRQTKKITGRKSCTFWRFCAEHMDLRQRRLEFWTRIAQETDLVLYYTAIRWVVCLPHYSCSHLSCHLTWKPYSHKIHIYPLSFSCPCSQLLAANFLPFPTTNSVKKKKRENWLKEFRNNEKLQMSALKWGNCITHLWEDGGNQKWRQLTESS